MECTSQDEETGDDEIEHSRRDGLERKDSHASSFLVAYIRRLWKGI
jgi:hypothetical protein